MWRVTFVGQDRERLERLARDLDGEGYRTSACLAEEATSVLADGPPPDVLVVDASSANGAAGLVQEMHGSAAAPTMVLLEEAQLCDRDLPRGVDDFLVVPARAGELAARVGQMLQRRHAHLEANNKLRCGDLVIKLASREVFLAGRPVTLAYKEYELLRFLLSNSGTVFSREALLSRVWGYDFYGGARTVDVHIRRLRSKIEDDRHSFIETVRNVGYRLHRSASSAGIANRPGGVTPT